MLPETSLLCEIIQATPNESLWHITSDSWDKIPKLFGVLLSENDGDWIIRITDNVKENLKEIIAEHEIAEKVVHMDIESKEGVSLLRSWDRMAMIIVSSTLGISAAPNEKYPDLEFYIE